MKIHLLKFDTTSAELSIHYSQKCLLITSEIHYHYQITTAIRYNAETY